MEAFATKQGSPLPDRIGLYQVVRQLPGTGSLQVYLAHEDGPLGFSRDVILKVASPSLDDDTRDVKELGREATACAKLNHPSIVRTHHFFEHEGALVLVLEYVDGITLAELCATPGAKGRRLDDDAAFHIGISILEALAHAHSMLDDQGRSAPVVHRAVSPSNILVAKDGVVKLGGFGFAKTSGAGADTTGSLTWEPAYMAPEQVTEQQLTPKVDVYAAALVLWELLTGRPGTILPKDPLAVEGILRAVTQRKPQPLATLRRDLPKELVAAVDAALTFSPDKRTISCGELAKWMQKVVYVGEAKKVLGARVRAALAATAKSVVTGSPVVSIAAAPVVVSAAIAAPPVAGGKAPYKRERTLLGVAPPSLKALTPRPASPAGEPVASLVQPVARSLPPVPTPPPARPAQLPPPPRVPSPNGALSAPPMEGPPIQEAIHSLPPMPLPGEYQSMDPVAAAVALQRSFVERLTETLNRPSFFEGLRETLQPKSLFERLRQALRRPLFEHVSTDASQRPSLIDRLKAPTPWPRNIWLAAWIGLGLLLLSLIVGLSSRPSVRAAAPQPSAVLVAPPPAPVPAAPLPVPTEEPAALAPPEEPVEEPISADPVASTESLGKRGIGNVTVHSLAAYASVYVMFARYGKVEQPIAIPCGRRFLAIGVPAPGRREPVWLAPGRKILIPCGGAVDVTMNPRALRKPLPAFNPTQL